MECLPAERRGDDRIGESWAVKTRREKKNGGQMKDLVKDERRGPRSDRG